MALLNSLPKLPVLSHMTTTEESIGLKLMRQTHPAKMNSYTLSLYLLPSREQTYIPVGSIWGKGTLSSHVPAARGHVSSQEGNEYHP